MTIRPEAASVSRGKRLAAAALEPYVLSLRAADPRRPVAWLAVGLDRSDRTRALAQHADALLVLARVVEAIESMLRADDRLAVVAVDELWIVLADAPSEAVLRLAATALRERVTGRYAGRGDDDAEAAVRVEVATGGAYIDDETQPAAALAEVAGHALVDARGSEDRIAILGLSTDARRAVRAKLERRLRAALEGNELEVWLQPQVDLRTGRCESFEALVRWPQQPGRPEVGAALIASICEECGLIGELTRFVLNTTLRHLMAWQAHRPVPRLSVNLSALTLRDASFPSLVQQACETWGVPPSQLVFELTEGAIARQESATIDFMQRLRHLGCGLSIDDFGTGYSSFAYLRRFPVQELKIDRAFVGRLATDEADRRIVRMLVDIAHTFGLRALAEGVERPEVAGVLAELGCDAAQGWHYAPAMPADQARAWVERFNARAAARHGAPLTV
jgi:EAL domain-containing protein (putative c-di-GMP-specific phosphodiesterase class I)/GGDEF domain-containing protein